MQSKFLEKYLALQDNLKGTLLHGDTLLVEVLPEPELRIAKGSSIVIARDKNQVNVAQANNNPAAYGVVLANGPGYMVDGEHVEVAFEPGNVVLLPDLGFTPLSRVLGNSYTNQRLGFIAATQVKMSFESLNEYMKAEEMFND